MTDPPENEAAPQRLESAGAEEDQSAGILSLRDDRGVAFSPRLIPTSRLGATWRGVLAASAPAGRAGFAIGGGRVEYRDVDGRLRGVLVVRGAQLDISGASSGQLLLMVDPAVQRRGIGTALLFEAERRRVEFDPAAQVYTRAGWRAMSRYLRSRSARSARRSTVAPRCGPLLVSPYAALSALGQLPEALDAWARSRTR